MSKLIIIILFTVIILPISSSFCQISSYPVNSILELSINSSINPATLNYLNAGLAKIKQDKIDMLLIKLNTPGGLVSTTKDILTKIGDIDIPTAIWITPEGASATSAGAIIASGAHLLFMSPGTNIGAATPITMGKDIEEKDLRAKAINDLVALVKGLGEARNRNGKIFGEMIEKASSFSAQDALKNNLINGIISNEKELLDKINGQVIEIKGKSVQLNLQMNNTEVVKLEMDLGQKILDIFANPSMAYILFIIGAALFYLEFQAPGGYVAGSVGAICLLLAGIGFQVLPLNWGALSLIILAFILFILEMYITTYGMVSIAAIASLIVGSLFLFRTDDAYMHVSTSLVVSTILGIVTFIALITIYWIGDSKKNKKQNFFSLKGKTGMVIEELPGGLYHIKISGEIWKAKANTRLEIDQLCKVIEEDKDNMTLIITKEFKES